VQERDRDRERERERERARARERERNYCGCAGGGGRTFVAVVDVPDLGPAVLDDDVSQSAGVLRPHVQLVGDLLSAGVHRHPGRDERHPERGAVRLDGVECARHVSGVEREDSALHYLAYCNQRY